MDSSTYPPDVDNIDNMDEGQEDMTEGDDMSEPETDTTTQSKCKQTAKVSGKSKVKLKKKVKIERSWVWEHFTKKKDNRKKCNCHYCGREMSCKTTSGTSNLTKHLKTCKKYLAFLSQSQNKLNRQGDGAITYGRISEVVFRDACNDLLVMGELALSFIESTAWRIFCERVKLYKPHSRRTATRDIVQKFVEKKEEMRNLIGNQKVSLTTDIWVAPKTGASYMVITAHWIDAEWCLRKLIIGFKNISDHKGKTIAAVLIKCLADWRIKKVFTITVDNSTANTSALRRFKAEFKAVGDDSLVLGGEFLHMRCAAHIINLVVKDGLKDVDSSVVAIRNGISYVRSSTERLKSFELRVDNGKMSRRSLPLDVKTRWNSTYLMLKRGLKFRLAFEKMGAEDMLYNDWFDEKVDGSKRIGPPTEDSWESVDKLVRFLGIFYHSTLTVSASESVNSFKCYGEICDIQMSLVSLTKDPELAMQVKAKSMVDKFDKYWEGLKEINLLLIVASVFNPANKMHFARLCFEMLYGKGTREAIELEESVKQVMNRLFEEYNAILNKSKAVDSSQTHSTGTSSQSGSQSGADKMDVDDDYVKHESVLFKYKELVTAKGLQDSGNELENYLKESVENPNLMLGTEYDVLSWWKCNAPKYHVLSEIAKNVLAMQVSSVASESAFSTSNRVLDPYRSCLTHYTIEVLMCVEQWLKSSVHLKEKGAETTTDQILAEIVAQDDLEREFNSSFHIN